MNDFGSGEVIAIVTAGGALITAVGAAIVNIIIAVKTDKKVGVIEHAVNSAASAAQAEIRGLQAEVRLMRSVASEKKETAALLAQAAAKPPKEVAHAVSPLPQPLEVKVVPDQKEPPE